MKTEGQTKQKLKQVLFRHLKKHLDASLKAEPENCRYNREPSRVVENRFGHWSPKPVEGLPRICIHAEQAGVICDQQHPLTHKFAQCPFFTPVKSKGQLKAEFVELARSPRDKVAEVMPDAAALMWVLDQESGASEVQTDDGDSEESEEEPAAEPEPAPIALRWETPSLYPWWQFWTWGFWPWNRKEQTEA